MPSDLDREKAFRLVEEDVRIGIGDTFRERPSDEPGQRAFRRPAFDRAEDAPILPVPWIFDCRHAGSPKGTPQSPPDAFHELFPTGRDLTINGVTVVEMRDGEAVFHRYVDWIGVLTQLGLTVSQRVLMEEEEYRTGLGLTNQAPDDDEQ